MTLPPPTTGDVVAGKYRLVELLGEGGMGAVWVAENVVLRKRVALKLIRATGPIEADQVDRFLREAVAASRVKHPAIVEIHDAGIADAGLPWIAMELLSGESLARRLERGPLSIDELGRFALPVLDALGVLHDAGIVHRDIKPDNIFLERAADGAVRPKLLDFGIAKQADLTGLTKTGAIVGTAFYLSPEQARGSRQIDGRADLYAMGVVLFESLSGHMPYEASSITELIAKMFTEAPRDLSLLAPRVAPSIAEIVRRCLERDPASRPQSARALQALLASAIGRPPQDDPRVFAPTALSTPPPANAPSMPATFDLSGLKATARRFWWLSLVLLLPCCCWCSLLSRSCAAVGSGVTGTFDYQWGGMPPLAIDVDGHAPTDAVGSIVRVVGYHSVASIVAIDGGDGSILWESEQLPIGAIGGPLAVSDDGRFVVLATLEGDMYSWDTLSGGVLASGTLREAPRSVCRDADGAIAIALADGTHAALDSIGRAGASARGTCTPIAQPVATFSPRAASLSFDYGDADVAVPGMHVESVATAIGRPDLRVARGWRESGTEIPMIAILDGERVVVVSDVPGGDPMRARSGAPGAMIVSESRLVVFYGTRTSRAMAAFDTGTGARVFDVDLESASFAPRSAALGRDRVWVESGHVLDGASPPHRPRAMRGPRILA